jgi:DNA-binding SARP family transcriptional activator/ATP/maltotriose-dependent transcriptional regulator MalT
MKNPGASKSVMPALPSFTIDRPRLFALIDANAHGAIWLHGPPGAGKTTLARSYARHAGVAPLFVNTMREAVTLPGLINALSASYAQTSLAQTALPVMEANSSERADAFAQHYFEALADAVDGCALVILDDLHRSSNPDVFNAVAAGMTQCAGRLMIIVTSQHLPDATFAEPLARGQLTIVGRPQLALDEEEATALAAKLAGNLSDTKETATRLLASTGGWAAGVMLGLQYAGASNVPTDAAHEPTTTLLARYAKASLPEQALAGLAVLRELATIPDAALDAHPDGTVVREALARLAARGLFVDQEATTPSAWRLHDLLKEALRPNRQEACDAHAWAQALAQAQQPLAAAKLATGAKDFAGALQFCAQHAPQIAAQHPNQLLELAAELEQRGFTHASLSYWAAHTAARTDRALADTWAERAYTQASEAQDWPATLSVVALMLIERADEFSDTTGYERWGERLEALEPSLRDISAEDRFTLLTAQAALFQLRGKPDPTNIQQLMEAVHAETARDADAWLEGARLCLSGLLARTEMARASEFSKRTNSSKLISSANVRQVTKWLSYTGFVHFYSSEFLEAKVLFEKAHDSAVQTGEPSLAGTCIVHLIRTNLELGEVEEAHRLGLALLPKLAACSPWTQIQANIFIGRTLLRRESFLQARDSLERAAEVMKWGSILVSRAPIWFVEKIQSHVALREFDEAVDLAAQYSSHYAGNEALYGKALGEMVRALKYDSENDSRIYSALESGFAYAQQLGFKVFFRSLPKQAALLCGLALERKIAVPFVRDVVRTRKLDAPENAPEQWPWRVWIQLLGGFRIQLESEPLQLSGKVAAKPLELIKLLASNRNMTLQQDAICGALWPDTHELNAARKNLESTVSRARKLIGEDAIRVADGRVSLDIAITGSDVQTLGFVCRRLSVLPRTLAPSLDVSFHVNRLQEAHKGEFLPGEDGSPWMEATRQQIRGSFVHSVTHLAAVLSQDQRSAEAIALLEQAVGREPLAEDLYGHLMRAYMAEGRRAEALHVYRRCKQFLSVILGVSPSTQTEKIRSELLL